MDRVRFHLSLLIFVIGISTCFFPAQSDLVITKLDRKIDLSSQIVRSVESLKVGNSGPNAVSDILLVYPEHLENKLAYLAASFSEGKGKTKGSSPTKVSCPKDMPEKLACYSLPLRKELGKGESVSVEVKAAYTHILRPFPEKITQADIQLVAFQDSAHYLSPYAVKGQSLTIKLPEPKVESYTKLDNTKFSGSEIKYGPYENVEPFSYKTIVVHYVNSNPFTVARDLVREIEISHWGNVQITENYELVHAGAELIGEFSRLDFQARPHVRGAAGLKNIIVKLPARAHSIYYRDEIGNISTSNIRADSQKILLDIEPRYPMFGGWRTAFTIGYGLPLKDYLFYSEGRRFLDISFFCPMSDVLIENLTVKIVLPEGSKDITVSVPFSVKQSEETKLSHLDLSGRPVIVLQKNNVVPEHNENFQVYYRFNNLSLLREPLMLIFGFFLFFVACVVYTHADLTISKSSPSYLAKLQWDEVLTIIQHFQNVMSRCLVVNDKLEASLRDLSRTGDVQACKATRKAADALLKDLAKELKPLLTFLQSSSQSGQILPKVEDLIAKEKELQEKLMLKHSTVVDAYEKKLGGREIENRVASVQQKITLLRQEVDDLVEVIDEI